MANNRIYLRCKGCGETLFLGKCFGDGYYWQDYGKGSLSDQINEFYAEHTYCGRNKAEYIPYDTELFPLPEGFCYCEGAFDIVYENNWETGLGRETE